MPYTVAVFDPEGVRHSGVAITLRLARTGECRAILAADTASAHPPFEQGYLLDFLTGHPTIRVADLDRPEPTDVLLVPLPDARPLPANRLWPWVRRAGRVFGLSEIDADGGLRAYARQLVRSFPHFLRCRGVLCRTPLPGWHPFHLLGRWAYFSPGVHPNFWLTPGLLEVMFGATATGPRDLILCYAGNRTPDARETILRQVESRLVGRHGCRLVTRPPADPSAEPTAAWIVYSPGDLSNALSATDFVRLLDRSRFCLCPPGWGTWTHRLTEAVVRGAVPIAAAAECQALGLRHLEHAVAVSDGDWVTAVDRALGLSDDHQAAMRANLAAVTAARFAPDAVAEELARFLLPRSR